MIRFVLVLAIFLSACTVREQTVVPSRIVSTQASFDGNQQDSGIKTADAQGFVVSANWIARYDAMLVEFGGRFSPAVKAGDRAGILIGPEIVVTAEVMSRFIRMNQWRKAKAGQ
jgi:hypothetical protein